MSIYRLYILGPFLALLFLVQFAAGADAQRANPTIEELTATFLFNFTKFTDWPADVLPAQASLVVCMSADTRIERALQALTKEADVNGHRLKVRAVDLETALTPCHLLYVDKLDSKRALQLLKTLNGAPVLSVSDFKNFAPLGGSVQFFVEDNRLRFAVNLEALQRTNVRMSSRLLSLAKIVKDNPALIRR